jgi:hypothetical protein
MLIKDAIGDLIYRGVKDESVVLDGSADGYRSLCGQWIKDTMSA